MNLKRFRTAGILFVVLLALGGLATWDEWKTKQEDEAKKTEKKLADFKPEDVVEVTYISRPEPAAPATDDAPATAPAEPVNAVLAKLDGTWRVIKPVEMLADTQAIDNLLQAIASYQYEKVVSQGSDTFAAFGLKEPTREIRLKFTGTKTPVTIAVGLKAPVGYSVYSRTSASDDVMIGGQQLLTATSKTLHEFRDKILVKVDEKTVSNLVYTRKDKGLRLDFGRKAGAYEFSGPNAGLEVDTTAVKDFVDDLNQLRVERFIDVPTAEERQALADPAYSISWQNNAGPSTSLVFALVKNKLVAAFATTDITRAYELADDIKDKIAKATIDFRDRRIFKISIDDFKHVEVDGDSYARVGGEWYKSADATKFEGETFKGDPKTKPEVQSHLRALLVDLQAAKTSDFISENDAALKKLSTAPLHRLKIGKTVADKTMLTVDLFADDGDKENYVVRVSGATSVYRVAKTSFNSMTSGARPAAAGDPLASPEGEFPPGLDPGTEAMDGADASMKVEDVGHAETGHPGTGH